MFMTCCRSLLKLELLDEEMSFLSDDDSEDFEISRPRERQISTEYDPDNDDYQMQVKPELPEALALTETQLIKKQITQLQSRMDQGGDASIMNHYHKVKEELELQLELKKDKTEDEQVATMSRLSTCDSGTDISSLPSPTESRKEAWPPPGEISRNGAETTTCSG
ncbi:unnamed protein product [Durusdinium trenchii]|uniref:Uncharacterized protein n=1 Tax=Durusdinium trenchii TaxID=1381693 RepID=A0ABP0SI21_9DINO|eukprot:g13672.t1